MSDAAIPGQDPQDRRDDDASLGGRRFLTLMPMGPADQESQHEFAEAPTSEPPRRRDWRRWRGAASLAAVVLIGAGAAAAQWHAVRVASADHAQTLALAHRIDGLAAKLAALDANRSQDDLAALKKTLAEFKSSLAATHDLGGAVAQLSARVERMEKDQTSRLDKLDKDAAQHLADIAQRLDKLEAKTNVATAPKTDVPKADPGVSMETTGAIDKPKPRLRNFYLSEIHNGYAMIDSPQGEIAVAPGDDVPGGGRVLRIERHGREWVVVTTMGQIGVNAE